jgi:hypothetical protein
LSSMRNSGGGHSASILHQGAVTGQITKVRYSFGPRLLASSALAAGGPDRTLRRSPNTALRGHPNS